MITLNFPEAPLLFNEGSHSYFCNGSKLKSVTTLLKETLFADKYSDVDEETLARAAEFGSGVHKGLEVMANAMIEGSVSNLEDVGLSELQMSVLGKASELLEANNVLPLKSEYLVTDEKALAGSIDLIANVNDQSAIVDYKFTYNCDEEYLSWQESIYAYLFEKMTGQHIDKLYAVWVPKRDTSLGKFIELQRKTTEQIEELIEKGSVSLPAEISDLLPTIYQILEEEKKCKERKESIQALLLMQMEKYGIKSWKTDYFDVTYVAPITKKSLDSKALLAAHPEINANDFMKESTAKAQVRIKLK